ncbi:MAG: Hsp20/alpha crystallin family protein [Miltoncostaeaceae bacterium]
MPALVRFDPFREITTLREDMNRLFSRTLGDAPEAASTWSPAVDIFDAPEAIVLKAELPGLDAGDIQIEVDDNVLTLRGERRFEDRVEEGRYHRVERAYGAFQRTITLPQNVRADAITANVERGVLEVRVPKAEEARPRKIEVQASGAA